MVFDILFAMCWGILNTLASWPPPAANARPSGLKRHSRGEDAFKEGRCIQGGTFFKKADRQTDQRRLDPGMTTKI